MKKFKLIQKITALHPANGVALGLSTYTGGMLDSGHWFEGRLLMLPKKELKKLLKKFDVNPTYIPMRLDSTVVQVGNNMWYYKEEERLRKKFEEGIERYWLGLPQDFSK